ncbi:hypothetical protein GCK72_005199 [Caenorhabditis remanei]|uniref:Uncharacterized protein n=1 Tax=Caenorhabditis remanei TaxID=31234 RepID=A0A6A5HDN5_CAERE|nr:hypothetical protein GCK72_005199 [Caenorhabditis remanei]KAF1765247.1 hypothetical protein GCK72_005199 [Caenorhabditis remanei]
MESRLRLAGFLHLSKRLSRSLSKYWSKMESCRFEDTDYCNEMCMSSIRNHKEMSRNWFDSQRGTTILTTLEEILVGSVDGESDPCNGSVGKSGGDKDGSVDGVHAGFGWLDWIYWILFKLTICSA